MTTINAPRELLAQWLGMFEGGIASNPLSALRERTRGYLQSEQPQKYDGPLVREHAADVANCAMMLADIAGVLSRE